MTRSGLTLAFAGPVQTNKRPFISGCFLGFIAAALAGSTLTTGCGRSEYSVGEFQAYVKRFEDESARRGQRVVVNDLIVRWGDLPEDKNGNCRISSFATPVITINQRVWPRLDEPRRELLLFHELGHCVLKREHDDRTILQRGRNLPDSVMHTYLLDSNVYQENREHYLDELFSSSASSNAPAASPATLAANSVGVSGPSWAESGDLQQSKTSSPHPTHSPDWEPCNSGAKQE